MSNGPLDEALLVSVREHYPGPIAQAALFVPLTDEQTKTAQDELASLIG